MINLKVRDSVRAGAEFELILLPVATATTTPIVTVRTLSGASIARENPERSGNPTEWGSYLNTE